MTNYIGMNENIFIKRPMVNDLISHFVKLMRKESFSDSELDLFRLGNSLGLDLTGFASLKASQDNEYVNTIRAACLKLFTSNENHLSQNNMFYIGSIDFMTCDEPNGKKFFLLETNGGSNRGLSILTNEQQGLIHDGYLEAVKQALRLNRRNDDKLLVLVGIPPEDGLIHEKLLLIEHLRKCLRKTGKTMSVCDIHSVKKNLKFDIVFIIADYRQLSGTLSYSNNWVLLNGEKISVLIGDGIARRLANKQFQDLFHENVQKINTLIVNPIFKITDDKSLTYLASYLSKEDLEKFNLKNLIFTKVWNEQKLIEKLQYLLKKYKRPFIIKPHGGSGGAGVLPFGSEMFQSKEFSIEKVISWSKKEYYDKFLKNRNPFPYTVQEMAQFSLIDWKNSKHAFDLRLYLAQQNSRIIPIGGLARIARGTFKGTLNKQEFVVNLSGYDGQIEVERGLGLSRKNCEILNLTHDDLVKCFSIGCVLFANMAKNYYKIVKFSKWDEILGE